MIWKILSLLILLLFYGIYFGKMILQSRKGIQTDQIAKRSVKDKIYYTELALKAATFLIVPVELLSIFGDGMLPGGLSIMSFAAGLPVPVRVAGLILGFAGDIVFGMAVWTMKDSWRAGLAEDDSTEMITEGIYQYSRNPAFLGFDMVYMGILLIYCNIPLILFTLFAMGMLHLQIKQEEVYLQTVFGEKYVDYRRKVHRYWGRKRK